MLRHNFYLCLLLLSFINCFPQTSQPENSKEVWFDSIVGIENSGLINGPEYFIPFQGFNTNPFFGSLEATKEKLRINNMKYFDVPLLYDCYVGELVLRIKNKQNLFAMVQLDKNRIDAFTIQGHEFQKMLNPIISRENKDFYDVLYEHRKISLVCKRVKIAIVDDRQRKYRSKDRYFLIRAGEWIEVSGYRDFYKLGAAKKKIISEYIKKQKIKKRKLIESELIATATFCNTILND